MQLSVSQSYLWTHQVLALRNTCAKYLCSVPVDYQVYLQVTDILYLYDVSPVRFASRLAPASAASWLRLKTSPEASSD